MKHIKGGKNELHNGYKQHLGGIVRCVFIVYELGRFSAIKTVNNVNQEDVVNKKVNLRFSVDKMILEIPVALLVFSQENRDQPYKINDREKMIEYIRNNFLDFNDEAFFDFLDSLFDEAFESGECWIEFPETGE